MQVFVTALVFVPVVFVRLAVEDDMPVLAQRVMLSWQQTMAQQQMMAQQEATSWQEAQSETPVQPEIRSCKRTLNAKMPKPSPEQVQQNRTTNAAIQVDAVNNWDHWPCGDVYAGEQEKADEKTCAEKVDKKPQFLLRWRSALNNEVQWSQWTTLPVRLCDLRSFDFHGNDKMLDANGALCRTANVILTEDMAEDKCVDVQGVKTSALPSLPAHLARRIGPISWAQRVNYPNGHRKWYREFKVFVQRHKMTTPLLSGMSFERAEWRYHGVLCSHLAVFLLQAAVDDFRYEHHRLSPMRSRSEEGARHAIYNSLVAAASWTDLSKLHLKLKRKDFVRLADDYIEAWHSANDSTMHMLEHDVKTNSPDRYYP